MNLAWTFGAVPLGNGVRFRLYAPAARRVALILEEPAEHIVMESVADDFFECVQPRAHAGTRYRFDVDGLRVPDPASRYQPEGVHGPSEVVDLRAIVPAAGDWRGRPWHEFVIYEMHVGAFTPEGTYAAAIAHLDALVDLGITALELMPLAEAPGARTWGYDGVLHYAPFHGYGRPDDLARFITAAHQRNLAVLLDVVYNHFGPEGNYLHAYARTFFTERYATPWGAAIDFTSPETDAPRRFFIENARFWLEAYGFDGLRLDATQMIFDERPRHVLRELHDDVRAASPGGREIALIVENEDNDVGLLRDGYDAQWNDDVHHALHVVLTGETHGYYTDYAERPMWHVGRALTSGFAYQGESSAHRGGSARGAGSADLPLVRFVDFLQNHDQIGNRARGERIGALAPAEAVQAATALLLLAPSVPMLFMGEEWDASTPFTFFCDFEPELARAVTEGRRREFAAFPEFSNTRLRETIPDPGSQATFAASVLRWEERERPKHAQRLTLYRHLLRLRAAEIVPHIATVRGTDGAFETIGERGLRLRWALGGGRSLHADANLCASPAADFEGRLPGRSLYATHAVAYAGDAPPWSVRWSLS